MQKPTRKNSHKERIFSLPQNKIDFGYQTEHQGKTHEPLPKSIRNRIKQRMPMTAQQARVPLKKADGWHLSDDGKMIYRYGATVLELWSMVPAHTYGDIVAWLPQHKILFVGDIGFFYVAPWCQNAHPSKWIEVCHTIDRMDVQTIVPGHGPLGGKAELADMRDYLVLLKAEAKRRYDARMTAGAAAADIRMGKYDNWIGPERIVLNVQRFYDEFGGTLTPAVNTAGIQRATEEYNAARKAASR